MQREASRRISGVVVITLPDTIRERGFSFIAGETFRRDLGEVGSLEDWPGVAASWNDLDLDCYLPEGARDRRRRFAVYSVDRDGRVERLPHQPHYQPAQYNVLFGGVDRWFAPVAPEVGASAAITTILRYCDRLFRSLAPTADSWRVETHQFRIEARAGAPGKPTPEGVHRDGVDFVLVLLVERVNIVSGETTVYDLASRRPLGSFTLTSPFDAALVDDARVAHGVTPVSPLDPSRPGHRDVLVVTFRSVTS